jgi:glycosyltransferase involved in cell wall biosynthesis
MTTNKPSITVSLSAYNNEKFIEKTIQSVLSQTFRDFEFIIVNDGSKDDTLKIIEKYAKQDARIIVIDRENKGIIASKNEILALAKGVYIANIDGDDIALPERFRLQKDFLDSHPEMVCVGSDTELIDEKGRFLTKITHNRGLDIRKGILEGHGEITNPAAMIRTDAFKKIGGCHADYLYAEDLDVWLRLDEIGGLENMPIALTQYRIHPNSASEKFGTIQRQSALKACQDAWKRRNIEGKFTAAALWRAGSSRESQLEYTLKYGWLAWSNQQCLTATLYGIKAIKINVLSKKAWQLFYCGIFKKHANN